MLKKFESFWLSFPDNATIGTHNFMSLIVKIISLELGLLLSTPAAEKAQYCGHLSFNPILQLINAISSGLQKLLKYFNGTAIVAFFRVPLFPSTSVFPNN